MFSKTIITAAAIAAVSANSIGPRDAAVSTLGTKIVDALKQSIAPCAAEDSYVEPDMYLLKCVETTLVSEISLVFGKVQPSLMFTPYRDAGVAIESGITVLDSVVQSCVDSSANSEALAKCHVGNTERDTVLGRFVDHFVVPVATCEGAEDVLSCMDLVIDEGLELSRPTLEGFTNN